MAPGPEPVGITGWHQAVEKAQRLRRKGRLPTALRLLMVYAIWVAFALAGAGIFYACEHEYELHTALDAATIEIEAGVLHPDDFCNSGPLSHARADSTAYMQRDSMCGPEGLEPQPPQEQSPPRRQPSPRPERQRRRQLSEATTHCNATMFDALTVENNKMQTQITSLMQVVSMGKQGKQQHPVMTDLKWSYPGSLFFAFQVMTTVGYGTFAPQTPVGRVFTVVFGIMSIVLTGFSLGVFTNALDSLLEHVHDRLLLARRGRQYAITFKTLATCALLVAYILLLGLFSALSQGWSYGDAMYFSFVTISTIGLGDFTLAYSNVASVIAQWLAFLPGLVCFTEFVNLGGEASRQVDAKASQMAKDASQLVGVKISRLSAKVPSGTSGRAQASSERSVATRSDVQRAVATDAPASSAITSTVGRESRGVQ